MSNLPVDKTFDKGFLEEPSILFRRSFTLPIPPPVTSVTKVQEQESKNSTH